MTDDLSREAAALAGRIAGWRRDFHRRPEIAFHEFETSAVLKKFFAGLGCPVRTLAGIRVSQVLCYWVQPARGQALPHRGLCPGAAAPAL